MEVIKFSDDYGLIFAPGGLILHIYRKRFYNGRVTGENMALGLTDV